MALRRKQESHWKSFADLAMGLLAAFLVITTILLADALNAKEEAEDAAKKAKLAEQDAETQRKAAEDEELVGMPGPPRGARRRDARGGNFGGGVL